LSDSRKRLAASDHPNKDVRKALKRILESGSFQLVNGGHWGMLRCDQGCCQISVNGSPRNARHHARDLEREAAKCPRDDGDVRNKLR
jgi:hypothetical protein